MGNLAIKNYLIAFGLSCIFTVSTGQNLTNALESDSRIFHDSKKDALRAAGLDLIATDKNDAIITESQKIIPDIKDLLGDSYGSFWVEYNNENIANIIVGVKNSNKSDFSRHKFGKNITFRAVPYSLKELEEFKLNIISAFNKIAINKEMLLLGAGVDYKKNKIIVSGLEKDQLFIQSVIKNNGIPLDSVEMEVQEGPALPDGTIYGGKSLITRDSYGLTTAVCTAGFNVIVDNIYPSVITTAHCNNPSGSKVYFDGGLYL